MKITKQQLKQIIKEELENIDEANQNPASQIKAIQGSLQNVMQGLQKGNTADAAEQLEHIINVVLPNLMKQFVMNRQ